MMRIDLYKIKKKGMQVAVVTTGALLMSFTSIFAAPVFSVHAEETKEDVEQQKEEAQQAQEEAQQAQEEANANAEKYQKKVDKLTAAVNELDKQATDISTQIVEKKQQAEDLQNEIDETQTKLAEAQVSEDNQYEAMKKRIQYLYEEGDVAYIDALMSSASFEDSLNKSEYVDQLSTYDQKQLNKLVKTKNDIAEYQQTLKDDLADVEKVKADLETKQADLDDVISQKNAEINKYSDDVEMQKALAAEYAKQESELDDKLAELARQEQQRLEEERKQREAEQQQQDNNGGSDNSGSDSDNSGSNNGGSTTGSGQFIWPVSGPITDYFGPRESPTAGASSNHMGIDIGCSYGVPIAAADAGVVTVAEWGESGGNYVMIDHGNGFVTMYLHNSSLAVSVGDVVSQGQTIAYAGSTGYSTGTHCHFSVFLNGSYVNPLDYL